MAEEPGAINDSDENRHRVAGNASSDELERGWLNADVNRRQVKSRNGDDSDSGQRHRCGWYGMYHRLDAVGSLNDRKDRKPVSA